MGDEVLFVEAELGIYKVAQWKPRFLETLAHAEPALDLSAVTEMDGAGLQLLLFAQREARASGKTLRLTGASAAAKGALRLAGQ